MPKSVLRTFRVWNSDNKYPTTCAKMRARSVAMYRFESNLSTETDVVIHRLKTHDTRKGGKRWIESTTSTIDDDDEIFDPKIEEIFWQEKLLMMTKLNHDCCGCCKVEGKREREREERRGTEIKRHLGRNNAKFSLKWNKVQKVYQWGTSKWKCKLIKNQHIVYFLFPTAKMC